MFTRAKKPSKLDDAFDKALTSLDQHEATSDEYAQILRGVSELHRMKLEEKPDSVKPDTVLLVGANILGILLIIRHEHVNVITSRAMSTLIKPR